MSRERELEDEVKFLKSELDRVNGIMTLLKRNLYGPRSEKVRELPPEQLLFNEIEKEAALPEVPPETETITYQRKKGRGKRKPFPDHLPREQKIIDLPEEQKVCPHDGHRLKEIGEETSLKVKTTPARTTLLEEIKKKYGCPHCDGHVAQARANSILPGTIATPELLAFLIYSKFFQGLPLYRLEEQYRLQGLEIRRGTMARWLIRVKEQLIPLYNLLQDRAFESGYMAIDATHVQVLKEPGREASAQSFMWARGSPERGIVLFDYDPSGGGKIARKLMEEFQGALQADAHRGYGTIPRDGLRLLGCMMHARRRFHDAYVIAGKKPGMAAEGLALMRFLYDREDFYKEMGLTPAERKIMRDREIAPSFEAIKQWCEYRIPKVPKSSHLGNAIHYFVNEYAELSAFLADGRYEMDNGWLERAIKKFAIGRNAWLFCDTVEGAHASSLLYSLSITAKLNGKDPFKVLTEIFTRLPDARTAADYDTLVELLLSPVNPLSCRKKEG